MDVSHRTVQCDTLIAKNIQSASISGGAAPVVSFGTYTPVGIFLTAVQSAHYTRVGSVVTVWITGTLNRTSGDMVDDISLPAGLPLDLGIARNAKVHAIIGGNLIGVGRSNFADNVGSVQINFITPDFVAPSTPAVEIVISYRTTA
jgi:hypothetical protein